MYDGFIHADNEHDIKLINACLAVNLDKADEFSKLKDRLHAPYYCERGNTLRHFLRKQHVVRTH